ncbi:D-alanyl-D-alanine carboxypeptidase/D-alanyl-D-alanine-endopeptidase [Kineococcus gynurae]|uniref:D-alanyl-D-alanine carboxypeptidase/D-alanyl-D-alanine-endopeptidase n=1 Tax=Kineococcus gynurae TaxID=452979 RepID=A0ABV5LTW8_9ACTN
MAAAAAVLLVGGYGVLDAADLVPGPLTIAPVPTPGPLPTAPGARLPSSPAPVLPELATAAPEPAPTDLAALAAPLLTAPELAAGVSVGVVDVRTGESLLGHDVEVPRTPASTTKLLTAVTALQVLGPQSRARTRVLAGPGDEVVLVAGGDALLSAGTGDPDAVLGHAGLTDLADATAAAVRAAGRSSVTLRLDDSIFSGPSVSPAWGSGDVAAGYVGPVTPLAVDQGRLLPPVEFNGSAPRDPQPAQTAARTFAGLLAARGLVVTGGADAPVAAGTAPAGAEELAGVDSATTAEVVEIMLTTSDNTIAEVLARRAAVALGRPGTFDEASAVLVEQVASLGVDVEGVRLQGGSGLGRGAVVPVRTLTGVLRVAAEPDRPRLGALASGLAIGGVDGTLLDRYRTPAERGGLGVVRAKTGTLNGVTSLAGYVVDADGRLLAFAVVADRVPFGAGGTARRLVDDFAAGLAACGCRAF